MKCQKSEGSPLLSFNLETQVFCTSGRLLLKKVVVHKPSRKAGCGATVYHSC